MELLQAPCYRGGKKTKLLAVVTVLIVVLLFMLHSGPQIVAKDGRGGSKNYMITLENGQEDKIEVPFDSDVLNRINDNQQRYTLNEDPDDLQFMREQAEIQRQRQETLRKACETINIKPMSNNSYCSVTHPKYFIFDEKADLIYCPTAKIASTSWKMVFEQLAGLLDTEEETNQNKINQVLGPQLTLITADKVYELMGSSLTFMFTRHPFSRVLSAYRNKLDPRSTLANAPPWQNKLGQNIINRYRHNKGPLAKYKLKKVNYSKRKKGYDLTFSEFVRFLGDMSNKNDFYFSNIHWCEVNEGCSPCNVKYGVIGKLETINDDAKYILKLAHLDANVSFPVSEKYSSPTFSSTNASLDQYFKDVPADYILKLFERYQLDFKLFGYELPPIALKKLEELGRRLNAIRS